LTPKSDDTRASGTLPLPELNPLLNPVLNKHLGRWAEVYFTNPPEKRDEAVTNLLRELESEPDAPQSARPASAPAKNTARSATSSTKPHAVKCQKCGFENDLHQRFCGECGTQLGPASLRTTPIVSPPLEAKYASNAKRETSSAGSGLVEPVSQFGSILHLSDPVPRSRSHESTDGDGMESSVAFSDDIAVPAGMKSAHRAYIGLALAVIIGGLGYMAWRSGQFGDQRSIFPAQAPAAATTTPSAHAPAPPSTVPEPLPNSEPPSQTHAATPANTPAISSDDAKPQNAAAKETLPTSKSPASPALSGNGSQELATALTFLNGSAEQRDSTQAAQWLWKAVEKKNTAATVLLAGLYLRGDGVQKNCDQGRVLLDAAADKGSKDAAGLLQNLQAFGCQ
jgi:hypothetical protein